MTDRRASDHARSLAGRFAAAGVATPELDARLLVSFVLTGDAGRYTAVSRDGVAAEAAVRLEALARRRLAGEPVARLLGRREFWSRDFALGEETLVPRPDTETLVEAVLARINAQGRREQPLRILDLGTGSGCILIALLCELPAAFGVGTDLSVPALRIARRNADANGVGDRAAFVAADWDAGISGPYDVIVANPPYIPSEDIAGLAVDVARFEPRRALDGGPDGLSAYRALLPAAARLLSEDGSFLAEIGHDQAPALVGLIGSAGLDFVEVARDLEGRDRVVVAARPPDRSG